MKNTKKGKGVRRIVMRGDVPCEDCHTRENIIWSTDNVFWNNAINRPKENPILCIPCFVIRFEKKYIVDGWNLVPEFPWKDRK